MIPVALNSYLEPFQHYFDMDDVSEICINQPGELWVELRGEFIKYDAPLLTSTYLLQLARLVAEYNHRDISRETPTLSSTLPNGMRIQLVVEPACARGSFICSIRKPSIKQVKLSDYFSEVHEVKHKGSFNSDDKLCSLFMQSNYEAFLQRAILLKKNIIISGGTSTGKTTLLNFLLNFIPAHERIITIETDREVMTAHPNIVHLLAAEEGKSVANMNMLGLLKSSLRLRPDRILVSELRAEEAFPYLRAINSGHPGSITTLHADSTARCFEQLAFMVIQSGSSLSFDTLINYAQSIIDIVVQIKRTQEGKRYIDEIYFNANNSK